MTISTSILHEKDVCKITKKCGWIFLRMTKVSKEIFRELENTHFMFNNFFF